MVACIVLILGEMLMAEVDEFATDTGNPEIIASGLQFTEGAVWHQDG